MGAPAGVGTFRSDTNWAPYSGAVSFDVVPEPATCLLLVTGLLGVCLLAPVSRYFPIVSTSI